MESNDSQSIGKDIPLVDNDTTKEQTAVEGVAQVQKDVPLLSTRSASQITLVQEAPGAEKVADDREKVADDRGKLADDRVKAADDKGKVADNNVKETESKSFNETGQNHSEGNVINEDKEDLPLTNKEDGPDNKERVSIPDKPIDESTHKQSSNGSHQDVRNEDKQVTTVNEAKTQSDKGLMNGDEHQTGLPEVGPQGSMSSIGGDKDTNESNIVDKNGVNKPQGVEDDTNKMADVDKKDKSPEKTGVNSGTKSPSEDGDSVKDTDPLLAKTDSQKTLQSDTGSSVKSDSSNDAKKPENKKKHSYIPIVASSKDMASTDPKRRKSDGTQPIKPDLKRDKDKSRTGSVSSGQNIALKEKGDNNVPTETKGETTFSVVNEEDKKNVKFNESDLKDKDNKDKKNPITKRESKIPELDKKKQNLVQKSLQREKAVLTKGDVKSVEKGQEKAKPIVQNSETVVAVAGDKKVPLNSTPSVEVKPSGQFKPKSILARAILKKVKGGSGQPQEDTKHLVPNGQTPSVKTPPNRKSLTVPSPVPRDSTEDKEDRLSIGSRRDSTKLSLSDSMSRKSVDYRVANATTVTIPASGQEEEKPKAVVPNDSWIRSAIPYLPMSMAIFCLFLNIFVPGLGTVMSGFAILCCGKTRVQSKDDHVPITLCVNVWVGVAQLFTVTFLLVGWFWSMAWGIKMIILSLEYRAEQRQKREKELQALALSAFGTNGTGRRGLFG